MLAHFVITLKKPIENYKTYKSFAKDFSSVISEQRHFLQFLYGELQDAEKTLLIDRVGNNYNTLADIRILPSKKLHWTDANDIETKVNKYARQLLSRTLNKKISNNYYLETRTLNNTIKDFLKTLPNVTEFNDYGEVVINED